ncbi:MAG: EpsG family protein [Ruminococcaceae bacterium]|nr:EpsG family protein [Oscillospiraceae bacterium]
MNVFLINMIFAFVLGLSLLFVHKTEYKKKMYVFLMTLSWVIISGLRGMSVGPDTLSYRNRFNITLRTSWRNLFDNFYIVYVNDEGKDPGYSVFEKLVQIFTDNYQVYLVIIAILFFVSMGIWLYKNSSELCLSYMIFSSFLFGFYAITGIRQTIATVLAVFLGTKFIKEKSLVKFLIVMAVAFTIHKSSICFLPFYFISSIPVNKKTIAGFLVLIPVTFIFNKQIFSILGYLVGYEYSELENKGAYGFTILYAAVLVMMLLFLKKIKENCENYKMLYNALFMGMLFIPIVFVNPTSMRVVQYYSLFIMLSVPELYRAISKNYRGLFFIGSIAALFLVTNVYSYEYVFFWQ